VLDSLVLQMVVFPVGVLYLLLHAGPLLRLWHEPSIRGGTRWQFFASEVALFVGWALASPVVWRSPVGRVAVALHLGMHVGFTLADYFAHDFLLRSALVPWARSPWLWFGKEFGLFVDTASHGVLVALVAASLPPLTALALCVPALAAFAWVTRGYLKHHGGVTPREG